MSSSSVHEYDFIVVGAGPAGSSLASRLADTRRRPKVLLVEAGGDNSDINLRVDGNKLIHMLTPSLNWGYKSTPTEYLAGRGIDFSRGKGLGGTSTINFTVWNKGARDDMEAIADLTGDEAWRWYRAQERWKSLERFHGKKGEIPDGVEKYLDPKPENHGHRGALNIGFPAVWDEDITRMMDIWNANGFHTNLDGSNGEGLGVYVVPMTSYRGVRVTAADLLFPERENLTILTGAHVRRVLFNSTQATGVQLVDGRAFTAKNEVILSAGSLDSPKILMHSGIGPADQLSKFRIPTLYENPNVGQNYRDHYHIFLKYIRAEKTSNRPAFFRDRTRQKAALREWQLYRSGDYANIGCGMSIGHFKSDAILNSAEFAALPEAEKKRLSAPTIPSYEVVFNVTASEYCMAPDTTPDVSCVMVFVMNSMGKGQVRLQSADPKVPLSFEPSFLEHPYDKRVAIEATRETMKVAQSAEFQKDNIGYLEVPKSDSDEDILKFWRDTLGSTWHMSCTLKMGREEKGNEAVVDTDFKVYGVQSLRVADMSVVPIIPSCHTQTYAYQVGMIAAEKITMEYGLN